MLEQLQQDLDAARSGALQMGALARRLREAVLPSALPLQYHEVLGKITDSIESSALFSGDSCSFSGTELLDALQTWVDKARAKLDAASTESQRTGETGLE